MWERALRRSGLPVAWSGGFSPHPLLSFGLALPTGCESLAEYVDVRLTGPGGDPERAAALARRLSDLLPEGVAVVAAAYGNPGAGSLQQEVTSCSWELEVLGLTVEELTERIGRLLAADSLPVLRERKGRPVQDDLRPSVLSLAPIRGRGAVQDAAAPQWVTADLATRPRGVRPLELMMGLGARLELVRARRMNQWIERDGVRREPLAMAGGCNPGAGATHAAERAS
jgi:radical SAM-linked protein